jgi:hypothetical protein
VAFFTHALGVGFGRVVCEGLSCHFHTGQLFEDPDKVFPNDALTAGVPAAPNLARSKPPASHNKSSDRPGVRLSACLLQKINMNQVVKRFAVAFVTRLSPVFAVVEYPFLPILRIASNKYHSN